MPNKILNPLEEAMDHLLLLLDETHEGVDISRDARKEIRPYLRTYVLYRLAHAVYHGKCRRDGTTEEIDRMLTERVLLLRRIRG